MNKTVKSIVVLTVISLVVAIALAGVNAFTAPLIAEAEREATRQALTEVYPSEASFEQLDISKYNSLPTTVTEAYAFSDGGYVVKVSTSGFNAGLVVICGIDAEGKITGAKCLASGETESVTGKREYSYGESFVGVGESEIDGVDKISGATYTSNGYKRALKDAIAATGIFGGAVSQSDEGGEA